jgi:hypothetical protein
VLAPLCGYVLFAAAGLFTRQSTRRKVFLLAHVVSMSLGIVYCFIFPVYPIALIIVPLVFAALGIVDKRNFGYYLIIMQILGIAANIFLLAWEFSDGRSVPVLQLVGW